MIGRRSKGSGSGWIRWDRWFVTSATSWSVRVSRSILAFPRFGLAQSLVNLVNRADARLDVAPFDPIQRFRAGARPQPLPQPLTAISRSGEAMVSPNL